MNNENPQVNNLITRGNQFDLVDIMKTAWGNLKNAQTALLAVVGVNFLLQLMERIIIEPIVSGSNLLTFIVKVALLIVGWLFMLGSFYMGIQRARGTPLFFKMVFIAFKTRYILQLIGLFLLQYLLLFGMMLPTLFFYFVFPSMMLILLLAIIATLAYAYIMARVALVWGFLIEKDLDLWAAICLSWETTRDYGGMIFILWVLIGVILFISAIPLLLGLLWTLPWAALCYGEVYKRLVDK